MEIRRLIEDDLPAHEALMREAFSRGERAPDDEPIKPRVSPILGAFEGGRLLAAATVHDLHLTWGGHDAPTGGVAGVACTVAARGRGHVAALLSESLRAMRDAGQFLSGLYPFSYAFYRRHGWEWVGEKRRYTIPTTILPAAPEGRDVRTYDGPEALDVVRPVYDAFARHHRGMTTRRDPAPDWWARALEHWDDRTCYVHAHHDPDTGDADGYFTFRYPQGEAPARVGEFFANTPAAYRGLLSVLHYYGTQIENVEIVAPAADPLGLHVPMHHDLTVSVTPLFMGRVVDAAAALRALPAPPAPRAALALQIHDPQCDWNHGVFAVSVEQGQVTVTSTSATPGVVLDIQALTQAYWGRPALPLLRAAGRLQVSDEEQFAALCALLPPADPYLRDYF